MKGRVAHAFAFKREKRKEKSRIYYDRQVSQSGVQDTGATTAHGTTSNVEAVTESRKHRYIEHLKLLNRYRR
jgi:hypothetical protein